MWFALARDVNLIRFDLCVVAEISPRQIRAARSLLGWTQQELADRAVVSGNPVQRLERGVVVRVDVYLKLWRILEAAGIEFIPAAGNRGGGGAVGE